MTKKVFTIDTLPGLQRDGTVFDMNFYTGGQWVRFQRGRPRKIGGYRSITNSLHGYSRGLYLTSVNNLNTVYNGYNNGLETLNIDNNGVGAGITAIKLAGPISTLTSLVGGSAYTAGTYTNVPLTGGSGTLARATIVVAGGIVTTATITIAGINYAATDTLSAAAANIGGTGSGFSIKVSTVSSFTASDLNMWQFDSITDTSGATNTLFLAHPGQNLTAIDSSINTPVLQGAITGTTMSPLGAFSLSAYLNSTTTIYLSTLSILIGAGQAISGSGIPANTTVTSTNLASPILSTVAVTGIAGQCSCVATSGLYIGQTVTVTGTSTGTATGISSGVTYYIIATNYTTTFTLSATSGGGAIVTTAGTTTGLVFTLGQIQNVVISNAATASGASTLMFDNNISVSGGVVTLHPYVFVYGNNGFIKNCSASNPTDWVSADANEVNVATGKIVQGLPVRGGSNAPSGLFWSLDSLIRVSYIGGVGTPAQYWRYDLITSQSSILSSQSAIEYDGIYYWCGVDRFLMYNGVVKELKNNFNQNYFFDNLNYTQRQKVYVNKIPRFGEIWWFFPSGNATECNDAIVYNIREDCWYDAGTALGARRSSGYFSQVFHYPLNVGTDLSVQTTIFSTTITTVNGNATIEVPVTNQIALQQVVVAVGIPTGSYVIAIAPSATVGYYTVTLSSAATASDTVSATFNTQAGLVTLWQHEIGTDEINGDQVDAIESFFETSDLGWVAGGPAQTAPVGDNKWLRVERVEPDFIQTGVMSVQITGRPYAQAEDVYSQSYPFDPTTNKIDMREQRREIRLRFTSNTAGGDYQLGKVLLSVDFGDVRGY
jgi:hypothetical protein